MRNPHQLFLAFFIPFAAALMLLSLGDYIFGWTVNSKFSIGQTVSHVKADYVDDIFKKSKGEGVSFSGGYEPRSPLTFEYLYQLLIFGLFVLSAILPFFVIARNKPIETNGLRLNE